MKNTLTEEQIASYNIKNTKQSSNNSTSSLNSNDNTISSRTRSKTRRAYKSQSSISNEEDATQLYDDVVYQEDSGHGYVDEDESEFMTTNSNVEVYEDGRLVSRLKSQKQYSLFV